MTCLPLSDLFSCCLNRNASYFEKLFLHAVLLEFKRSGIEETIFNDVSIPLWMCGNSVSLLTLYVLIGGVATSSYYCTNRANGCCFAT